MCHHLLCSALMGGADSVSGSGPVLLCPGMSDWAFFRSFWRCFDCPAYVQTAHVCSQTCWALRLTTMFWPLLNLKNQSLLFSSSSSPLFEWFLWADLCYQATSPWWITFHVNDWQNPTSRCVCPRTWPAAPKRWRRNTSWRPGETSRTFSIRPAPASSSSSRATSPPSKVSGHRSNEGFRMFPSVYSTAWRRSPVLRLFLSRALFWLETRWSCRRVIMPVYCNSVSGLLSSKHMIYHMITVILLRFVQAKPEVRLR